MPALPNKNDLIGIGYSKAVFRSALGAMYDFISGLLGTTGTTSAAQVAMQIPLGAGVYAKTGAYTITAADRGKVLKCSGTFTITHLAAATAGNGFSFAVVNEGSGVVTVGTNVIGPGGSSFFVSDGSGWLGVGGVSGVLPIANGGTGGASAAAARAALGVKAIAAGAGGVGSGHLASDVYGKHDVYGKTVGNLYAITVNGIAGTWRCLSSAGVGPYYVLYEREY